MHVSLNSHQFSPILLLPQVANSCNTLAGRVGDMMHLELILKKLNFGQLKVSRSGWGYCVGVEGFILELWGQKL